MLTFIRGANTFQGPGEIYVKLLPNGEPAQLTHDNLNKMSPVVAPDGSSIAYTVVGRDLSWDTFIVPLLGGEPRRMLPNAAALTWVGPGTILFSEIKSGAHMAIVTADEDRANSRDIYVPPQERGMGHRSALSPGGGKEVLVAEMQNGGWLPCRVVPFDGSSPGKQVGPAKGGCTYAAWSPDGEWMYLNSNAGGAGFHIWRQRGKGGGAEQVTFGPTEQEGIAMMPDGRSLISSVGTVQSSIWLHGPDGERPITSEESASHPEFSHDGKLYYLSSIRSQDFARGELWRIDLVDGRREQVVPGIKIADYDVSRDDRQLVFSALDRNGHSRIWTAPLDHRTAPRQMPGTDLSQPVFGPNGDLTFVAAEGKLNYLYRSSPDGSARRKAIEDPILEFRGLSPDSRWAIVWAAVSGNDPALTTAILAYPVAGGAPLRICYTCGVTWQPDAKFIYVDLAGKVYRVRLPSGKAFPPLPPAGIQSEAELKAIPGATVFISSGMDANSFKVPIVIGADPSSYVFIKSAVHRNLYRIPIP